MRNLSFADLADYLKHGREIDDTDQILLDTVCRFEEKDLLISKVASSVLGDLTIQEIFDKQLFADEGLAIL